MYAVNYDEYSLIWLFQIYNFGIFIVLTIIFKTTNYLANIDIIQEFWKTGYTKY